MKNIYKNIRKVKYIDAWYSYNRKLDSVKISVHEAYGYVKELKDIIYIAFIKCHTPGKSNCGTQEGIILPKHALLSRYKLAKNISFKSIKTGAKIAVKWKDITFFTNVSKLSCSMMYTEGVLLKRKNHYIILKNPETVRIHPIPVEHHPLKRPNYYYIPLSFIIDIAIIQNKK